MSKHSKIKPQVRQLIYERDEFTCALCNSNSMLSIHHMVYASQLGKGIPENLILLCNSCHDYAHKKGKQEMRNLIEKYLRSKYQHWDIQMLKYNKWKPKYDIPKTLRRN